MTGSGAGAAGAVGAGLVVQRIVSLARVPLPEAASGYAASGVPVFPCLPGGKRPLTAHGLRDASTDAALVAAWWQRWPTANIGLATGQVSGFDVLDVDVRAAGSGFETFDRVRGLGLADRWAMVVRTPSGGVHAYYPAVPGRVQRCWQSADAHIDFRGDGGYVIAPPSVGDGPDGAPRRYVVSAVAEGRAKPVEADRIRALLLPQSVLPSQSGLGSRSAGADAAALAAWVAVRREGERNRGLFWASCRLAESGVGRAEIETALTDAAKRAGLTADEIASTIRSATRTVEQATVARPAIAEPLRRPVSASGPDDDLRHRRDVRPLSR